MDLTQIFVLNLKKCRKNRGFSQKTLAERCNAAHSYIRQLESGTGHPSFSFIEKLADAMNIEPYRLFYNETATDLVIKPESIDTVKTNFLEKVAYEFDVAIDKVKNKNIC